MCVCELSSELTEKDLDKDYESLKEEMTRKTEGRILLIIMLNIIII